jgi:hypothetical protein
LQANGTRLRIADTSDLVSDSTYVVSIPAGFINEYPGAITWTFTTAPGYQVVEKTPANEAEDVALDTEVSVKFNKTVKMPYIAAEVTIKIGDTPITGVTYDVSTEDDTKLVLAHTTPFEYDTEYTVTIPAGAISSFGNAYQEDITWSFTTTGDVGIDKINRASVYPTLTKGQVTVNTSADAVVSLLDISGRNIATYESTGSLDLHLNYANGVYLIVINDAGRISTHKIVLQK